MSIYLYTSRLPDAYQEVEYIQSSGSQYIDTGFYPTGSSEIEFDFMMLPSSGTGSFGVDSGWTSNAFSVFTDRILCYGSQYQNQQTYFTDNVKYKLEFKNLTCYLNGSQRFTYTAQTFTSSYSCYVFAKRRNNSIEMYAKCRVYGLKLWNNGTLEKDFVPCYRKSDNVIGMYDIVNNQFYTNAGTGSFTKGNDITGEIEIKTMYIGEYINLDPITFSYTESDQHRTVPYTGTYRITCKGAGSNTAAGGLGQGDLQLTQGDEYTIVVGQKGSATSGTTYGFGGSSNYSNNRAGGGLSGFFTGSTTVAATDSSRALVIGGGAGGGQSSSRAGGKGGGETGQNGQGSNYGTAGGGGTQTGRNSGGNAGANQFNGGNGSGKYGWGGGGGWRGGNGSIGDGSGDDDKGAGGGSGYVISTASNRVLTQGGGSATGTDGSVLIEFIPS